MVVKSLIAQLDLHRAGVQPVFAQAPADHLAQLGQGGFEQPGVGGIFGKGVFVADGFGGGIGANFRIEPAARIQAARLARQRQPPLAEMLLPGSAPPAAPGRRSCEFPNRGGASP